jgi:hypothetical protein
LNSGKLIGISESDLRVTPQLLQAIEMSPLCLSALGIELEFGITRRAGFRRRYQKRLAMIDVPLQHS